ncbi:PAS domain S-box protein [Halobellus sp. GM3]|uniref:PAS domain S-box protein n=1 Tax=Halobellus sp. GM3 TaxID=3458410 RepID=UPI00403D5CFA
MGEAIRETRSTVRVLHVDDEPGWADLAATFLEREDKRFETETATSANKGLERLSDTEFDCIVSDYDMPGQSGIEFLEAVREDYPELPFILYTGKGSEEIAADAISAGVTDYLQKESGTSQYAVLANRIANTVSQYRSQRQIEESQKRLSLFIEQSPLGVIEWNGDFEVKMVNNVAEEILGYAEAELRGQSWGSIVPEPDREAVGEVVSKLLTVKGGHHSINKNVRKNGDRIMCEWHNRVVTDNDGDVVAIFSQFQNISERQEYKQQLEAALDNHPGWVYRHLYAEGWPLEYVKGNPQSVTGYTAAELEEMLHAEKIIHPDDQEHVWDDVQTGLEANEEYDLTYRIVTKDDEIRWVRDIGRIIEDPVTGESKLEGFIIDVTERRNRER